MFPPGRCTCLKNAWKCVLCWSRVGCRFGHPALFFATQRNHPCCRLVSSHWRALPSCPWSSCWRWCENGLIVSVPGPDTSRFPGALPCPVVAACVVSGRRLSSYCPAGTLSVKASCVHGFDDPGQRLWRACWSSQNGTVCVSTVSSLVSELVSVM